MTNPSPPAEGTFPSSVEHESVLYWATGKVGTNDKSGLPAAEYEGRGRSKGYRIWLLSDGTIVDE